MQSTKSPGASLSFPIPSVSLSQSPLLPCVPIQHLHVCNRRQRSCCGCDVNFYEFLHIKNKLATLVAIVDT